MTKMKILIDNGHGIETPGKRSPDGRFREYAYNRLIAKAVVGHLTLRDFDAELLVPEDEDITLPERVCRTNRLTCRVGHPVSETLLVSIHVNAAGKGDRWYNATGWSAYTCCGHSLSDALATSLYRAARRNLPGRRLRTDWSDGDPDFEASFYLLKHTLCAAVLTENFFLDAKRDLAFLESEEGRKAIVTLHVEGIIDYIKCLESHPVL